MEQNVGIADRIVRLMAGIVLIDLLVGRTITGWPNRIGWVIGFILIISAALGFCPLYGIFGWSTKNRGKSI